MSLVNLERTTPADDVAEALRDEILGGSHLPGSPIADTEVQARFRVSRDLARAGLARLEREGLLVHSLHRGLEVTRLSVEDVRDLYATRRTLEVAGLEALIRRRPADDVWLQAAVQSMTDASAAADGRAAVAADAAFHLAIVASTSSRRLRTAAEAAFRELRVVLAVADRVVVRSRRSRRRPHGADGRAHQRATAVGPGGAARPPAPWGVAGAGGNARRLTERRGPHGSSWGHQTGVTAGTEEAGPTARDHVRPRFDAKRA